MDQGTGRDGGRNRLIVLYVVVSFLYWVSLYLYVPTLPTYVESRSRDLAQVGVILSQYGLWQAIVRLPIGIAADWIGRRKPFILAGVVLCGVGAWVMGAAGGAQGLLVGRAITGLAASTWVPMTVLFSSLFPPREAVRATSILTVSSSIGRLLATAGTGTLNEMGGYSLAFFVAVGFAAAGALLFLPAPERIYPRRQPSLRGTGHLIFRRDVLLPSLLSAIGQYATWAVPFGFLPILAQQLGATPVVQSLFVTLNVGLFSLGGLAAATIANRIGPGRLVQISLVLLSLGIALAAVARSLATIWVAQFLIGIALGITYPVLMGLSIREVSEDQRTTAMGSHQAIYAAGMFAGPWLSGILADAVGLRPMLGITAFACLVLGTLLLRLLPHKN